MNSNSEYIKVVTFQHPEVVKKIKSDGIYVCSYMGKFHERTPNSYRLLIDNFKRIYPDTLINYPIFCWSQVAKHNSQVSEFDDFERMMDMTGFDEPYMMLILEVPKEKVMETDFYGFVDLRYDEEYEGILPDSSDGLNILNPREKGIYEIQAILGYIDKNWVKNTLTMKEIGFKRAI